MTTPWAFTDKQAWRANAEAFEQESGGIVQAYLIDCYADQQALIAAADCGNATAEALVIAIARALSKMYAKDEPTLCLLCDTTFTTKHAPQAFVVLLPSAAQPRHGTTMCATPVCSACCAKHDTNQIVDAAAKMLDPEATAVGKDRKE